MQYEREYGDKRHRELTQKIDAMTEKNDSRFERLFEALNYAKGQGWMAKYGVHVALTLATIAVGLLGYFLEEHVTKRAGLAYTPSVIAQSQDASVTSR